MNTASGNQFHTSINTHKLDSSLYANSFASPLEKVDSHWDVGFPPRNHPRGCGHAGRTHTHVLSQPVQPHTAQAKKCSRRTGREKVVVQKQRTKMFSLGPERL